jgi:hypothetical protein
MPVNIQTVHGSDRRSSFVICDKRSDINRVDIPLDRIEQWLASIESVAALLAGVLGIQRSRPATPQPGHGVGMMKGNVYAAYLSLHADGDLRLSVAGHSMPVSDLLQIRGDESGLWADKERLVRLVDESGGDRGFPESAEQRWIRLEALINAEKAKGNKAFIKTVAKMEGFSVSRLQQVRRRARELAQATSSKAAKGATSITKKGRNDKAVTR